MLYTSDVKIEFGYKIAILGKRKKYSAVRVKVLSLFSEFAQDPQNDGNLPVDEVILLMKGETF